MKFSGCLFLALTIATSCLQGRIWTDIQGRKIEAEMVRVEDDQVIVSLRGKETNLPLARLSTEDQKFVEIWKSQNAQQPLISKKITFLGQEMTTNGEINVVKSRLSVGARKEFGSLIGNDEAFEVGICLPNVFDPNKPQKILWICVSERVDYGPQQKKVVGELEAVAKTAAELGWVAIAVDTHTPIKRPGTNDESEYEDLEIVNSEAVKFFEKEWPAFKASQFAFTGNMMATRVASYWSGHMLRMKYKVIGNMIVMNPIDPPDWIAARSKCDVKEIRNLKHCFVLEPSSDAAVSKAKLEEEFRQKYNRVRFDYRSRPRPNGKIVVGVVDPIDGNALKAFLEWVITP